MFFKYFKVFLRIAKLKLEQSLEKSQRKGHAQYIFLDFRTATVHSDCCIKDAIRVILGQRQNNRKIGYIDQLGRLYSPGFSMLKNSQFLQLYRLMILFVLI